MHACGRSRFVWSVGGGFRLCFGSFSEVSGDGCGGLTQAAGDHRGGAAAGLRFSVFVRSHL